MNFRTGWARAQAHLLPERLEDYIGPDNPVRFHWTQTKLEKQSARLETRLQEYLAALDAADREEAPRPAAAPTAAPLQEKIAHRRARQSEVPAAKAELKIEQADVVAAGGYVKSQDIKDCQDAGLEPHPPAVQNSPSERAGPYGKEDFRSDAARDVYHCPAGGCD